MSEASTKMHYFMIAGAVYFVPEDDLEAPPTAADLNTISTTESRNFTARDLGQATQAMQIQLFKKAGEQRIRVVDCLFTNISYLGEMTPEEFMPQGQNAEQKPE